MNNFVLENNIKIEGTNYSSVCNSLCLSDGIEYYMPDDTKVYYVGDNDININLTVLDRGIIWGDINV